MLPGLSIKTMLSKVTNGVLAANPKGHFSTVILLLFLAFVIVDHDFPKSFPVDSMIQLSQFSSCLYEGDFLAGLLSLLPLHIFCVSLVCMAWFSAHFRTTGRKDEKQEARENATAAAQMRL